ncbi:hypothetical protein [Mycobacterium sp.]|jgi:hypothetical protein|uniref:hypothetical protein n=1 Tax=Mycobacterium sp. TaxID=1785 RepID=UPI002C5D014D|nr:hypothetical protein [Mycobacterium sp.]HXB89818.1 hypothetical protein [Mycobacterium sp.]
MMPTMCAELSAPARIGAVRQRRRLEEPLCRAAALIRADVNVDLPTSTVPASGRPPEHLAVQTSRTSDAR